MSYLAQKTRISRLTIGGVDYTSSMASWNASDSSAYEQGLVKTTGEVVLSQQPGGPSLVDYDRDMFKRGTVVTLDMTEALRAVFRHPRGYLSLRGSLLALKTRHLLLDWVAGLS